MVFIQCRTWSWITSFWSSLFFFFFFFFFQNHLALITAYNSHHLAFQAPSFRSLISLRQRFDGLFCRGCFSLFSTQKSRSNDRRGGRLHSWIVSFFIRQFIAIQKRRKFQRTREIRSMSVRRELEWKIDVDSSFFVLFFVCNYCKEWKTGAPECRKTRRMLTSNDTLEFVQC